MINNFVKLHSECCCEYCGEDIKEIKEEGMYVFLGMWDNAHNKSKVIRFHFECFRIIAGDEYLNKLIV